MKKEFVIRGKTASGGQHILEFGGRQKENKNMAYRITEFTIYPATNIGGTNNELLGTVTAGKTAVTPTDPDFENPGLIATAQYRDSSNDAYQNTPSSGIINDTFMITNNLILMVQDTAGSSNAVNWQCRFEAVKMTDAQTAVTNFKQYSIFDE